MEAVNGSIYIVVGVCRGRTQVHYVLDNDVVEVSKRENVVVLR